MKKLILVLMMGLIIGILSGCGEQVDELLGKVNQILDEQLAGEDSEDTANLIEDELGENTGATPNELGESDGDNPGNEAEVPNLDDGHGPDDGQHVTVDDLIKNGTYGAIDFPNGWPLPIPPEDWKLVQMIKDPEEGHEAWEGVICFDSQVEAGIEMYEDLLFKEGFSVLSEPIDKEEVSDFKHSTKFQYNGDYQKVIGDMVYYIDNYGKACTEIYFTFE